MYTRLLFLIILFTQCSSPSKMVKNQLTAESANYMRYIPGAGGGKGILFNVHVKKIPKDVNIDRFVVNDIEVAATLEDSVIVASVFYANVHPTIDNQNPEQLDPVLFNQDKFQAVVYFTSKGKADSIHVTNFTEKEQPLYP